MAPGSSPVFPFSYGSTLTVLEQGGHLGNISDPTVQNAIVAALAGLK